MSVSSVNVPTAASMSAQVSARIDRLAGETLPQQAGQTKHTRETPEKVSSNLVASIKATEEQTVARAQQTTDVNSFDISDNRKEALLAVKVEQQQAGDLIRELKSRDYKAMAYSVHGYKGSAIDTQA